MSEVETPSNATMDAGTEGSSKPRTKAEKDGRRIMVMYEMYRGFLSEACEEVSSMTLAGSGCPRTVGEVLCTSNSSSSRMGGEIGESANEVGRSFVWTRGTEYSLAAEKIVCP